ncbi:MAG TPA: hypothetical protein VMT16_15730 [Thermoanaerobaculia bacterium]|nr:hypothetical protein [Thermoanaerobaculia bacterium]
MALALALLAPPPLDAAPTSAVDPALLAGLAARSIGPAGMSGRVAALAGDPSDPDTLYVGAATGGVWKSSDGGVTWRPIFDDQPVHSIGALAVFAPSPGVVWVGTGEANPRNSVSVGNGVYRSLDGGQTWTHLGLEATERIHRIHLDPRDREVAYVCATGRAWADSEERGVYKTTDGGASWQRVLYVNPQTGCGDLAIDPRNPDKLIAAMWQYRRWPYYFRSGGLGSGIYVSSDAGGSWKRLQEEDGLPKGPLGRVGLAIAPSDPRVVYALAEAEKSAMLRSADGGLTWAKVNEEPNVNPRPFYFAQLEVDPAWPNRVYSLDFLLRVSDDGGKSWQPVRGALWPLVHVDFHAMWIPPGDPQTLWVGNDGGVAVSRDRGGSFRFVPNLPLSQFYHVAVDRETPYNVYGGLQDNGSWRGPAYVWRQGGIRSDEWETVGFGDGFEVLPDAEDATQGYSMWQGGNLMRWNLETGEWRIVKPAPPADGEELRFNWNAGLALDSFDPATVYLGSQYVHRSRDRGLTWETISPDLTTDNPAWQHQESSGGLTPDVTAAENYTTLVTIAPSGRERGVIWAGSDDGRVHLTRDGGASWRSVEGGLRPANAWVAAIEPSPHDAATAFAVLDDHRRSDFETYLFATRDYGASWRRLPTAGVRGYALSVVQDPVDPELLFLGTEYGLWVSTDGGASWLPFRHGVETASVMDLVIHPDEHDLVLGTHGRGIYVLDDVAPLRTLSAETLAAPVHLFPIRPAQQHWVRFEPSGYALGATEFRGENRPYGALLTFSLERADLPLPDPEEERARKERERLERAREAAGVGGGAARARGIEASETPYSALLEPLPPGEAEEEPPGEPGAPAGERPGAPAPGVPGAAADEGPKVKIRVHDAAGALVRTFEAPARRGVNRVAWDLSRDPFEQPPTEGEDPFADRSGPQVPPGTYRVTVELPPPAAGPGGGDVSPTPGGRGGPPLRPEGEATAGVGAGLRAGPSEAETTSGVGAGLRAGPFATGEVVVLADPRSANTPEDWQRRWDAILAAGELNDRVVRAIRRVRAAKGDLEAAAGKIRAGYLERGEKDRRVVEADPLLVRGQELGKRLGELEKLLWVAPETKGIVPDTGVLLSELWMAGWALQSSWDAPSPTQLQYLERARRLSDETLPRVERFFSDELEPYRRQLGERGVGLLLAPAGAGPPGEGS